MDPTAAFRVWPLDFVIGDLRKTQREAEREATLAAVRWWWWWIKARNSLLVSELELEAKFGIGN